MHKNFQKIIDLIKKTGDRVIVFDEAYPDNSYVILAQKDYEKLVSGGTDIRSLTEDELLDKINRDIAIWKSEQDFSDCFDNDGQEMPDDEIEAWAQAAVRRASKNWTIPENRKLKADEIDEPIIDLTDWSEEEMADDDFFNDEDSEETEEEKAAKIEDENRQYLIEDLPF